MGNMKNVYEVLVLKPEWKRPLGRLRHGLKDNIEIDLRELVGRDYTGCI
jgi:hypothetical protein